MAPTAEYASARGIEATRNATVARANRRANAAAVFPHPRGKIFINVLAYQPGAENTKPALRELAARTLAEFDLTGEID